MDYQGLYEDLLAIEARADEESRQHGMDGIKFDLLVEECRQFRRELLYRSPVGRIYT